MTSKLITLKRIIFITLFTLVTIVVLVIAFISPIAKYAIEKYSPKFLGRQIKLSWIYLNPFTGYVHISGLKVYSYQSDSIQLSAEGVSAKFAMFKMIHKTYEFESMTLDKPWGIVIQNHKQFNFSDLIERFTPKTPRDTTKPKGPPTHLAFMNLKINDGEFHYIAESVPVNYYIKHVNISSPGWRWDVDSLNTKVSLESGPSPGDLKADFCINLKTLDYRIATVINKFDINLINQYLQEIVNYGRIAANVDADVQATGNFGARLAVDATGFVAVNDLHFGKKPGEDYASFQRLAIRMVEVNPTHFKYYIDTIMLNKPYFKYERYDYLDNLQRMFGKNGENYTAVKADKTHFNLVIEIANYMRDLAENFIKSYYKIGKIAIYNGDVKFNDFSLRQEFSVAANPLNLVADSIDKNYDRMYARLQTSIQPYGFIGINLSLDPNDYGFFDVNYKIDKVPAAMFNPYLVTYTSFPMDRGTLEFDGNMVVEDSNITSNNHLLILDPRVGKRVPKKDTKWIPVPLIMSIVRERSEAIEYELPIHGRLTHPKFNLWNIIGHTVENIFLKPPSSPYMAHTQHVERQIEKALSLTWQLRQTRLTMPQQKLINKIGEYLRSVPSASITVNPIVYAEAEKEQIMFFEAKKKYYSYTHHGAAFNEDDSLKLEKMSVKDSQFVHYLDKALGDSSLFTLQEKCTRLLGQGTINAAYAQLIQQRENAFVAALRLEKDSSKVKFMKAEAVVPFNGFSYYKLSYQGEFPKSFLKAYSEMEELNQEPPREKFEEKRKQEISVLPPAHKLNSVK
jgi:hypothetical protein